jgi:uncharacterized membrane protein YjdF
MAYIPHYITFTLCAIIVVLALSNVFAASDLRKDLLQMLIFIVCFFQIATIITFAVVQWDWVANDHGLIVGSWSAIGWIAYDYLNKLFHLSGALLLRHWIICRSCKK